MHEKKHIQSNAFLIIIVLVLTSIPNFLMGKDDPIELFKQKKYEEALPFFNALLQKNPNDNTLFYYTGVCLTETNQFNNETIALLLKAVSVNHPNDVNFFLGKNYHALNDFKTAKSYYAIFDQNASKKEKKAFDLENKIDLCNSNINPFPHFQPLPEYKNDLNKEPGDNVLSPAVKDSAVLIPDTIINEEPVLEIPVHMNDTIINFILTSEIYYTKFFQFKTYKGKLNFINGWNSADTLNILIKETDSLRDEYGKTLSSVTRAQISSRVINLEDLIRKTKSSADISYSKASEQELDFWKQASEEEKLKLITENDSIKNAEEEKRIALATPKIPVDSIQSSDSIVPDTTLVQPVESIPEPVKTSQLIFKIQIGKYNTELPESAKKLFKKISALRKIDQYIDENNFIVYTIGELTTLKDAVKLQDQIRQESVKDAFVIAIKEGKRISLNEALDLKKQ